ncbi:MAG: hypothetical protein PHE02_01635 [Lachnospiraceae bacterium]|nr:hypothetical protein [Lachnospiraceae bacterium]
MKNRVVIITCYIGSFPEWITLWIQSCGYNGDFDFVMYTDQSVNCDLPNNLKIISTTLADLKNKFSKVLGFECKLDNAYKLCDYKVLYGLAFQDVVSNYDFWGHCDVDLIFGHLAHFIDDNILDNFDRIFEVGHLSLYRNNDVNNNLYKEPFGMYGYHTVFLNRDCMGFDEHTGITRIYRTKGIPVYNKVICADIDPHYRMFVCMDEDTVDGEVVVSNNKHQIFGIENGQAYRYYISELNGMVERQEVSYIHFMRKHPTNAESCLTSKKYCITYKEFVPFSEDVNEKFILNHDYAVDGIEKNIEYIMEFVRNGLRAMNNGKFMLRLKLRVGRIRSISAFDSINSTR